MLSVDRVFTALNPVISGILRSPFHWPLSVGLMLITVTGRRTKERRTFPVGYQNDGDDLVVLVSEAHRKQWWKNLLEPSQVGLQLRGLKLSATGAVIPPESPDFLPQAERTLARVPGLARSWGIHYDRRAGLDEAQAAYLRREIAMVRFQLHEG